MTVEDLDKRLKKLETKSNLFGSNYSSTGSSSSDLLLKTRGKVKIQIGSKFIDLIKDGKINVDSKFIYKQDAVGNKDGIYVVGEDIYLVAGGEVINIKGEIGTTYVSFQGEQETTGELKYQALTNIGFIYKDLTNVDSSALLNGIIYIESTLKLYTVVNGELTEYTFEFPNPFTDLFIIAKDNDKQGSLVILGTGENNSLKFNNLLIYSEDELNYMKADGNIYYLINDSNIFEISNTYVKCYKKFISNNIQSNGATANSGFRLYYQNGQSTLEVDNLIVRNGLTETPNIYPDFYTGNINSIESIDADEDTTTITLSYKNTYQVGDTILLYVKGDSEEADSEDESDEKDSGEDYTILTPLEVTITSVDGLDITVDLEISSYCPLTFLKTGVHINSNTLELIDADGINTKLGDISTYKMIDNELEIQLSGNGIYSKNGVFTEAQYSSDYLLEDDDNSSRFASTEWVNKNKSTNNSLNLKYNSIAATLSDIQAWITSNTELQNVISNTTLEQAVQGKFGILTLQPNDDGSIHLVAWVTALTEDNNYSHRSIDCKVSKTDFAVSELSTYILFTRYIGYYLAKDKTTDAPSNFTYIGTSKQDVSKEYPCLWYYDGVNWSLIDTYMEDTTLYIFVRSTNQVIYHNYSTGYYKELPAGFICYVTNNTTTECGYGKSKWISTTSTRTLQDIQTKLSAIEALIISPTYNVRPDQDDYGYMWYILKDADFTNPDNWYKIAASSINETLTYPDIGLLGNCDAYTPESYAWYNYDANGIITSKIRDAKRGTLENWKNKEWVKSFFTYIISRFLLKNMQFYNNITGWNFYYLNALFNLEAGNMAIWFGEMSAPTSDSGDGSLPKHIAYQVAGTVTTFGYSVTFSCENNMVIGRKLSGVGMGLAQSVGEYCTIRDPFYDISFDKVYVHFTDLINGKDEYFTV